jgi:hypothetical protein
MALAGVRGASRLWLGVRERYSCSVCDRSRVQNGVGHLPGNASRTTLPKRLDALDAVSVALKDRLPKSWPSCRWASCSWHARRLRHPHCAYLKRSCNVNPIRSLAGGFAGSSPICPARQSSLRRRPSLGGKRAAQIEGDTRAGMVSFSPYRGTLLRRPLTVRAPLSASACP